VKKSSDLKSQTKGPGRDKRQERISGLIDTEHLVWELRRTRLVERSWLRRWLFAFLRQ
jgi:hypothetical protein